MVVGLVLMYSVGCIENKGSVEITQDVEDSAQQNDTNTIMTRVQMIPKRLPSL